MSNPFINHLRQAIAHAPDADIAAKLQAILDGQGGVETQSGGVPIKPPKPPLPVDGE